MCKRIFSMKELNENDEEWCRPSNSIQTKANISATKKELLTRICELENRIKELETENTELHRHLKDCCIEIEDEEDTLTEEIINSIPEDWAEASMKNNIRNGGGRNYL